MNILLTNDDGVQAEGLHILRKKLSSLKGELKVCAPLHEQSGTGHGITIFTPIRTSQYITRDKFTCTAVNGSPADCVKVGCDIIYKRKVDIVISGINPGGNMSTNILYSGTVSAAMEALMMGYCAVAVSIDMKKFEEPDYNTAADFTLKFVKQLQKENFPKTLFNINVPNIPKNKIKGVKVTSQGSAFFFDKYEQRQDPMKRCYYWLTGNMVDPSASPDHDYNATQKGYISITPLKFDLTNESMKKTVQDIVDKL